MTVRWGPSKATRAPLADGCSPSPASMMPALTSSSLYVPIASSRSVEGIMPASLSVVALTITITRIVRSPLIHRGHTASLLRRRTSLGEIDIPHSDLIPSQPMQHLRPEGGVAVPAGKVTGPVRGEVGGEDGGTTPTKGAGRDHRVVAIARHEVSSWLERHPVIATERERGAVPIETGHRGVRGIDDLEAKPGDNLHPVIIRRNRNRQNRLDHGVVKVRDAVEPGEGEIAADHDEAAPALHKVSHHLAAIPSQWVRVGRGESGIEDHRVVADVAEDHDVVGR